MAVVNPSNSERTQQNGADKREHGADHQHIEFQDKGHGIASLSV